MVQIDLENPASWTILVVDDDADNVAIAGDTFELFGATVYTAQNGHDGYEVLKTVRPTFILLDLSMPIMDGWQLLEALRQNTANDDIPVIALTAHAMLGDKERALDAGFNGYISKPFKIDSILDDVKSCLSNFITATTH